MSSSEPHFLSSEEVSKIIVKQEYLSIPNRVARGLKLYEDEHVKLETLTESNLGSPSQLRRGRRALKDGREVGSSGRPRFFSSAEETDLEMKVLEDISRNVPTKVSRVMTHAKEIVLPRNDPIKKFAEVKRPTISNWIDQNPVLQRSLPSFLSPERIASTTVQSMTEWFDILKSVVIDANIDEDMIFNFDETSLRIDEDKQSMVVWYRGENVPPNSENKRVVNATLACTICADGSSLSPVLLYPTNTPVAEFSGLSAHHIFSLYEGSGYMTSTLFQKVVENVIIPEITEKRDRSQKKLRNALLLLDGASSHMFPEFQEMAEKAYIQILFLPPHSSSISQPLDGYCFASFKSELSRKYLQPESNSISAYRTELARILPDCLATSMKPCVIKASFARCGVSQLSLAKLLHLVPSRPKSETLSSSIQSPETNPENLESHQPAMHTKPKYQGKLITTLSQPKRGFAKKSLQHTKLNVIPTSERPQKSKQLTLDEIKPQKRQESTRAESVPSIIPLLKTRINVLHDDDSDFLDELTSEKTQVQDDTL